MEKLIDIKKLLDENSILKMALENIHDLFLISDPEGNILYVNLALKNLFDLPDKILTPEDWPDYFKIYHIDGKTMLNTEETPLFRVLNGENLNEYKGIIFDQSNIARYFVANGRRLYSKSGELIGAMVIARDITTQVKLEADLRDSKENYENLLKITPEAIIIHSDGTILYANESALKLLGVGTFAELYSKSTWDFVHPEFRDFTLKRVENVTAGEALKAVELKVIKADGRVIDVEANSKSITYFDKPAIMSIAKDITAQKQLEASLHHLAFHDALTNLPNRRLLEDRLNISLAKAKRSNNPLAVMFIDLDRFKVINDTFGHAFGDQLLILVAEKLKNCTREGDTVARHSRDEFIILLEDITKDEVVKVAQRILDNMSNPFIIENQEIYTSPSIGISMYPEAGNTMETFMKNADSAMYTAKEQGKNNYQFFNIAINYIAHRKSAVESGLKKAVTSGQFRLYYQPLVSLKSGKISGVEALIRWKHPELGWISPAEFIPIAEETGLIHPIGDWVLYEACAQNKKWHDAGYPLMPISVNLSVHQCREGIVQTIKDTLRQTELSPKYLCVEITESFMKNIVEVIPILRELKELGIQISLDDFGTGFSSLSYLSKLPIDTLKVDQSFVKDIVTKPNDYAIVKSIVDMAKNLNLEVTGEGIETEEQLFILREINCHTGQGYLFSEPLSAKNLEALLSRK